LAKLVVDKKIVLRQQSEETVQVLMK
jgi:hypothetical protein